MTLTLIAGPPCSGKTTLAREQAGDTPVIDFDDVYQQISGLERYERGSAMVDERASSAFRQAIDDLILEDCNGWIVQSAPRRWQPQTLRRAGVAHTIVLMVPPEVCLERVRLERPPRWERWVFDWFRDYQSDPDDEVMCPNAEDDLPRLEV
ncbi:MAG: AAA family ATPase [Actinomycetota bacterium]